MEKPDVYLKEIPNIYFLNPTKNVKIRRFNNAYFKMQKV